MNTQIEEVTIRVKSIFNEDKTKRYMRSYEFTDVVDGVICAVIIYSPRMSDAFLSGTTTQRAYMLMRNHLDQPIREVRVISLVPTLAINDNLPYVESQLDEVNYHYVEETLDVVEKSGGMVIVGWGSPGRLMHHATAYKTLFADHEANMFCIGTTSKGEPQQIRMANENTVLEAFNNESVKPKFRIVKETKQDDSE
ncbi:DUF1643 domain-containing protein [Exiguobacterium sp.]|uniref:DUF1643 domain-containing protein n=1 Tax=Exiguobacterium sp. TaxID=44751 RepID=UPI00263BA1D4|nr:DUF1643 domain-containing protein [Exiguobacterium sp.]MCC5891214.1 hypothetical protein [Exiguobacterium sp.]